MRGKVFEGLLIIVTLMMFDGVNRKSSLNKEMCMHLNTIVWVAGILTFRKYVCIFKVVT